jgi:hypothetical protein
VRPEGLRKLKNSPHRVSNPQPFGLQQQKGNGEWNSIHIGSPQLPSEPIGYKNKSVMLLKGSDFNGLWKN